MGSIAESLEKRDVQLKSEARIEALREVQKLMMSKTSAVLYLEDVDELIRREKLKWNT